MDREVVIVPATGSAEAARRVVAKLGGRKPKSQKVPVVVSPIVSRGFASMIFSAASGLHAHSTSARLLLWTSEFPSPEA